ncbi:MAG: hypothetical protein ACHQII_05450 [Bacteroidia bacterium]
MTKKDTFEIALKIFGLYLLTIALDSLVSLAKSAVYFFNPSANDANDELIYFIASLFRFIVYAFGFWLLVFKTAYVSQKLIKTNADSPSVFNINKVDLLQILFLASGIIIAFFASTELWSMLTMAILWNYQNISQENRHLIYLMQIGIPVTKALMALVLIVASGRLAKLFLGNKQ